MDLIQVARGVVMGRPVLDIRPECDRLKLDTVPMQEEKTLGDAMALRIVSTRGKLMLAQANGSSLESLRGGSAPAPSALDPVNARARRVAVVGAALAQLSDRPTLPWRFGVLDAPEVNAVSSPGGSVFVTRGALQSMENEDQLAGVLAHEMVHVTGRHALQRYGEEKARACYFVQSVRMAGLVQQAIGEPLPSFSGNLFWSRHFPATAGFVDVLMRGATVDFEDGVLQPVLAHLSDVTLRVGLDKEVEFAADAGAVDLLLALGYRPEEYIRFVERLPHDGNVFAQHPSPAVRRDALVRHLSLRRAEEDPLRPTARKVPVPLPAELAH